jgi:hypothetical protein
MTLINHPPRYILLPLLLFNNIPKFNNMPNLQVEVVPLLRLLLLQVVLPRAVVVLLPLLLNRTLAAVVVLPLLAITL